MNSSRYSRFPLRYARSSSSQASPLLYAASSAAILAAEERTPPTYACPNCDSELELDDIPERYLAFLLER